LTAYWTDKKKKKKEKDPVTSYKYTPSISWNVKIFFPERQLLLLLFNLIPLYSLF
jgi:hypothetical protein